MTRTKRRVLGVVIAIPLVAFAAGLAANEPRPATGATGARAEALTAEFEAASGAEGWERTGAIRFDFLDQHHYLWDRERHLMEVRWDDVVVQLPLEGGRAIIRRAGAEVRGRDARVALRDKAMRLWTNDVFWLNPIATFRNEGVRRSVIRRHGREALLVEYGSGGLTPGDAYAWMPARGRQPIRWAMWVHVLPIGGLEATWEDWITLPTGARVARSHGSEHGSFALIRRVRGARTLRELVPGSDPFAVLVRLNAPASPAGSSAVAPAP